MPELPEVETVRRALAAVLEGRTLVAFHASGVRLRVPVPVESFRDELAGRVVVAVRRRAKYLVVELEDARALVLHLGMTGSLSIAPADAPVGRHEHLRIVLGNGKELRFNDPRRFGVAACERLPAPGADPVSLGTIGPEPLSRTFCGSYLFQAVRGRERPIKPLLLDQALVAGVGNIYASEALHRARIHPERPAARLTRDECDRLARSVKAVLRAAIRQGGTTLRNYRALDGTEGKFQQTLHVYGREGLPCPECGAEVVLIRQTGRSTFFCPQCQS